MTKYAKWMIFANLALSIMFLSWSLGLYSQQMPWQSQIKDTLAPQIKSLVEARNTADQRWATAHKAVVAKETELPRRRAYYDEQMKIALTGMNNKNEPVTPAIQVLEVRDGLVVMNTGANRKPFKIGGQDALSLAGFQNAINKQLDEIRDTKQKIAKVVEDTTKITQQIKGTKVGDEAITAEERGLRVQVADARQVERNAQLEQEFLQTDLTNYKVDLEMLKRRQMALEARLKELAASVRN
jgi:hypothetical protein